MHLAVIARHGAPSFTSFFFRRRRTLKKNKPYSEYDFFWRRDRMVMRKNDPKRISNQSQFESCYTFQKIARKYSYIAQKNVRGDLPDTPSSRPWRGSDRKNPQIRRQSGQLKAPYRQTVGRQLTPYRTNRQHTLFLHE